MKTAIRYFRTVIATAPFLTRLARIDRAQCQLSIGATLVKNGALEMTVLFGSVWGRKNDIFPNGDFRKSICDQNCAPKKTQAKRIFSATLHVAVFDESSTD